ncbi:MAG: type III pantothenate kinase [Planctomycetota bacterium]|jgi:type III pantothenate kinase
MNIIAVDIGNTNINVALYLKDEEQFIKSVSGRSCAKLTDLFKSAWEKIPVAKSSKDRKRDGVIVVCSVKPAWTQLVREIVKDNLDERLYVIGQDLPLPMPLWVDEPEKVGVDRVVSAAAAYAVIKNAVVVADFGTAVTIDLVDDNGVFIGGVICPGLEISARALKEYTAQLPKVKVTRPKAPYGKNTTEAINCGLYYSAVATLQEVVRRYAESIGKWPHTVLTGSAAEIIKQDCDYIDSYVPDLVVKGIVLAYKKYIEEKMEQVI